MKEYDFASIKKYIQTHSDHIESVSLGMKEDWFWTAETVYENDHFTKEIDRPGMKIGGISGSAWATPCMNIQFKDGTEIFKDAYTGKSDSQKPEWFQLGCLSGPCQEKIDFDSTPRIEDKP